MSDDSYAFRDRNLLAIAFADQHRRRDGCDAGFYFDDNDGWPCVWVDGEHGQRSWHVHPDLMFMLKDSDLQESEPPGGWDGHTRTMKNERLIQAVIG